MSNEKKYDIEWKLPGSFIPTGVHQNERYISKVKNSNDYDFNTFDGETENCVTYPYKDVFEFIMDTEMANSRKELDNMLDKLKYFDMRDIVAIKNCINTITKNHK